MEIVELERRENENNKSYIYRSLRESIIRATIEPGEAISEPKLQQYFNVSRSPIREAISILAHEGLVEVEPQKTTRIVLIDKDYVIESRFLRYITERDVLVEMCKNKDTSILADKLEALLDEAEELSKKSPKDMRFKFTFKYDSLFHSTIFEYCGFKHIWKMLRVDNIQYDRFLSLYLKTKLYDNLFILEHRNIVKMIREKDIKGIEEQAKSNFEAIPIYLETLSKLHPDYFKN